MMENACDPFRREDCSYPVVFSQVVTIGYTRGNQPRNTEMGSQRLTHPFYLMNLYHPVVCESEALCYCIGSDGCGDEW